MFCKTKRMTRMILSIISCFRFKNVFNRFLRKIERLFSGRKWWYLLPTLARLISTIFFLFLLLMTRVYPDVVSWVQLSLSGDNTKHYYNIITLCIAVVSSDAISSIITMKWSALLALRLYIASFFNSCLTFIKLSFYSHGRFSWSWFVNNYDWVIETDSSSFFTIVETTITINDEAKKKHPVYDHKM